MRSSPHAHAHTCQSLSVLGSQLQLCISFMPVYLLYVFFQNFPITLNTVKNLNTFAPGYGYPVVITCVQLNKRPKPQNKCTGWGLQGRGQIKTQMCRFHQKPQVSASKSVAQGYSPVPILRPSPLSSDPKAGPMLFPEPGSSE